MQLNMTREFNLRLTTAEYKLVTKGLTGSLKERDREEARQLAETIIAESTRLASECANISEESLKIVQSLKRED